MELYKDLNSVTFLPGFSIHYLSLQECLARGVDILVRLLSKPVWGIGCGAWNCLHCAFETLLNCVNLYLLLLLIGKTLHLHLRRCGSFSVFIVTNVCWPLFWCCRFSSESLQGSVDLAPFCLQQIASVPKQVPFNQCPYFLCQICSLFIDGIKLGTMKVE